MAGRALTTTRAGAVSAGQHSGELSRARFRRPELYINREISLVEFSQRVLDEAKSARHPLLERVKFLSFVGSQMDEFMMIRLAGLYDQVDAAVIATGPDGMLPRQQIDALHVRVRKLLADAHATWEQELRPDLLACGVEIAHYHELTKHQRDVLATFFRAEILPVLTPLGVDPGHPFPHISNRSLNLAVTLSDPGNEPGDLFARVKVPATLRRLIKVPVRPHKATDPTAPARYVFTWLEELMAAHLDLLFPGFRVVASHPFRVLRDADFEVQTDEAGDLLETVEQGVMQRRFGATVNLSVQPDMPTQVRRLLTENLELDPEDVWEHDAPLGLSDLAELADIDRPDLKDTVTVARVPVELKRGQDPFMAIRGGDLLLHHPYDAFSSVADFIEAAAQDPQVLAIKQTLYRVGRNSPIVQALLDANARGKQVAVLVELKARFDEENNIEWARTLEAAGVHVVYGQVNLKTHAKVALVV
ncbi:MAG TPA: polyphosphate kinase 1, partial [Ktedonobacterales bacterium]